MDILTIEATAKTPLVVLNPFTGEMLVKGRSIPNDADSFWSPILSWFYAYAYEPAPETKVTVQLEYFNITSSKKIMFLLHKMHDMHKNGKNIRMNWLYVEGDDDMKEVGSDYASLLEIPFNLVPIQEDPIVLK